MNLNLEYDGPCPYGYEADGGKCIAIYKTFKQWVKETGVGVFVESKDYEPITYREFMDFVQGVLANPEAMALIREEYCRGDTMSR